MKNTYEPLINGRNITDVIRQRRAQILVHSHLFFIRRKPIIKYTKFKEWSNELVKLQYFWERPIPWFEYETPQIDTFFDPEFKRFNGENYEALPLTHPWVIVKAVKLLASDER